MFGLSFVEIAIVAVLALLLLGPDQLPQVAKTLGKGLRELRKASDDLRGTFETEMSKLEREVEAAQIEKPPAPTNAVWTPPSPAQPADAGAAAPVAAPAAAGLAPVVPLDQMRQLAQDPGQLRALARANALPKDPGASRAAARFAARAQLAAPSAAAPEAAPGVNALAQPVGVVEAPAAPLAEAAAVPAAAPAEGPGEGKRA
jgi:sec-independent protein translocase protein TatB